MTRCSPTAVRGNWAGRPRSVRRAEQPPADGPADARREAAAPGPHAGAEAEPVDIRRLLLVPETQNPKAIALFLGAALRMADSTGHRTHLVRGFIDLLAALRSRHGRVVLGLQLSLADTHARRPARRPEPRARCSSPPRCWMPSRPPATTGASPWRPVRRTTSPRLVLDRR